MAEVCREVIVMIESDKIGRKIPNLELGWDSIDILVTDRDIKSEDKQEIEALGITVICA